MPDSVASTVYNELKYSCSDLLYTLGDIHGASWPRTTVMSNTDDVSSLMAACVAHFP